MIKNIKMLLLVSLTFAACTTKEDEVVDNNSSDNLPLTAGSANFSKYVAMGNSLTAGFSDGALFKEGQNTSWTNIISQQFALVGGGTFKIPFMSDNLGGFSVGGNPLPASLGLGVRLFFNGCAPTSVAGISGTNLTTSVAAAGPYNNTGVPGAKCINLVTPGYASANPYFGRLATAPTQTVLEYATAQTPTFFSLWIGNNDVLGYALKGGDPTLDQITPSAGAVGVGFDSSYTKIVNDLTAGGAKGVVANIPYVTTIPMFTTITLKPVAPFKYFSDAGETTPCAVYPVSPTDIATINGINSGVLGPIKQILTAYGQGDRIQLLSTTVDNPILISDESLVDYSAEITAAALASTNPQLIALAPFLGPTFGRARHTKTGDLIPLTTSGAIATVVTLSPGIPANLGVRGITYPLEDRFILVPSEILELKTATDAYNATIASVAASKNLAIVDANKLLTQVATTGIAGNGFLVKSNFVTGGAFSLDGVHPSPRGYALIANEFIKVINAKYGSNLKGVDLSKYRILFPSTL
jgi:hypothetical protein